MVSVAAPLIAATASAQPADPLAPFQFLIGSWQAIDTPAGERGAFTFKFDVQQHVLVRTNEAVYDATASHPASRHDDLLIVYVENGGTKADYFDSEGHVIRYRAHAEPNHVVFVTDPDPQGPRYRLTYTLGADRVLTGSFEIAMPDAPDAFKPYLAWKAVKP
jgi:hypothetical protein